MKVLIADDEIKVCRLIQHLVDWDALEMDIVGFANDGKTAYESICEKKPDIVITDIRMPVYDGLELIRRAKEVNPEINFIVISGYSQFEYLIVNVSNLKTVFPDIRIRIGQGNTHSSYMGITDSFREAELAIINRMAKMKIHISATVKTVKVEKLKKKFLTVVCEMKF